MAHRADPRDIARMVSIAQVMRDLGWPIRYRNRADCGLCHGHSTVAFSLDRGLWNCHKCKAGGDVYDLVRKVNGCDFPSALKYVAELAGISLDNSRDGDWQRKAAERKQQRDRLDGGAQKLESLERAARLGWRDTLYECDHVLRKPEPWDTAQERRAQAAIEMRDRFARPAYTALAFGPAAMRAEYVTGNEKERMEIVRGVRMADGVHTDSGHWQEVIAA